MSSRWAALPICLVVLAGCGSGYGGGNASSNGSQERTRDAQAKSDARIAVSELEACFADRQSYAGCARAAQGQVTVSNVTQTGYVVTATSGTGTEFKLTKTGNGQLTRTCSKADRGGCGPGGTW